MKILITGASGYLGSLLYEKLRYNYLVIGTSLHGNRTAKIIPLDIRNEQLVHEFFLTHSPDVIIHTAAIASVSRCEKNPVNAFKTNSQGTLNIVRAANRIGARVILISSLAAKKPVTIYGESKRKAEEYVQNTMAGYEIIRLSMTFGLSPNTTSRRPFNKIISTLLTGEPKAYDDSWKFQPTYTGHFISIVCHVLEQPFRGRYIEVTVDKICTMYQIASDLLSPLRVQRAHAYCGRSEQIVDPKYLQKLGFPTCSYSCMIARVREELANFAKKHRGDHSILYE